MSGAYYNSSHASYQQQGGGWGAYPAAMVPPGIGAGWGQDLMSISGYNQNHGGGGGGMQGDVGASRYAAYDTSKNRNMARDSEPRFGFGGGKREFDDRNDGEAKRPRWTGRVGREPELSLFTDPKFRYWNLPAKAKVLLVSNLPKELTAPEALFNLFSFYGEVERIKVMRRRAECALIEFKTATFAAIARDYLDNLVYRGQQLVVSFSKFDRVQLPHESRNPHDGIIQDFSGPAYQASKRYSTVDMMKRGMKKICKPSKTIHIGGVDVNKTPAQLSAKMLEVGGVTVVDCIGIELKKVRKGVQVKGDKMSGYVEFGSVDEAIYVMSKLGNTPGMRLSFTSDTIEGMKSSFADSKIKITTGNETIY